MTDEVLEDRIREVFACQLALLDDHVEEAIESAPAVAPRATTRSAKRSWSWAAAGVTAAGIFCWLARSPLAPETLTV